MQDSFVSGTLTNVELLFLLQTSGRLQNDETQKVHALLVNIGIDVHYVDHNASVEDRFVFF